MSVKHISMMMQKVISISPSRFKTYLNMYMAICSFGLVAEGRRALPPRRGSTVYK